ncbi:hypothetical protein B0H13DRAFT_1048276 [Mycena leptocephala]|nr:hypothetical protein B0H13DRAFT_1048276 [Mycena leptocephala]
MDSDRQREMAWMDTMGMEYRDMGRDTALHDSEALRVAIIAENFLPKIDGSTITIAHLLQHLAATRVRAMLLGPESGMRDYAGARLFGTFGVPLRVYPGLKINFISPAFLRALRSFEPHVIHLVDPIWLGVQALIALQILFPSTPIVTSHHTNLPTYAEIFGYPYFRHRTWQVQAYLHSFARYTLVPSPSTARLLREKGWGNLRVVGRGVDRGVFSSKHRSPSLRASWGAAASDVVILSVGRLSPEKNLGLLVWGVAGLGVAVRSRTKLVFVGDGPYLSTLQRLCAQLGVDAIFMGQLTGKRLGEAVGSADVMSSPSITETFGQVTLQGMAAGLPVVGLYVEGTADLVFHGVTGLLLDPLAPPGAASGHAATLWDGDADTVEGVEGREGREGGVHNPNPHDSAVSLSLDPAILPEPPRDVDGRVERDVDVEERVPDSAISLSPGFCPPSDPSPLDLPDAALALEVDFFPGFSLDEQILHGAELAPSSVSQAPSFDSQDSGGEQGGAPRVGCFRTLAPLMRPESREFVRIVKR